MRYDELIQKSSCIRDMLTPSDLLRYRYNFSKTGCTHIICVRGLSASKTHKEMASRSRTKVVTPQWCVHSLAPVPIRYPKHRLTRIHCSFRCDSRSAAPFDRVLDSISEGKKLAESKYKIIESETQSSIKASLGALGSGLASGSSARPVLLDDNQPDPLQSDGPILISSQ